MFPATRPTLRPGIVLPITAVLVGCSGSAPTGGATTGGESTSHAGSEPTSHTGGEPTSGAPSGSTGDAGTDTASPTGDGTTSATTGGPVCPDGETPLDEPGLPHVHAFTCSSNAHVLDLVRAAVAGLGFDPGAGQGPREGDRLFVGLRYAAWIDQTGFHGKMNGLWRLNGATGDDLWFSLTDPDGRPVNLLAPGEDGEGRWLGGYRGGEHVEFPNRTPEPDDPPACAMSDWCNQFGLAEAAPITVPAIPWWAACNGASPGFDAQFDPVSVEPTADGLKLVYEAPLVKQADGDGTFDGDACGADFLFPDQVRRPVYLRLGYELLRDADHVDRTMQLRNADGNPSLAGDLSLIGGFVVTRWPDAYYLKRVQRFWRPEDHAIDLDWGGMPVQLAPGQWNDLSALPALTKDVLIAWADQPITISPTVGAASGRTLTVAHVGPSDNQDVGVCLCAVHGGVEMGGGLIHAGISLPIDGGQSTIEARRRLTMPADILAGAPARHTYEAETDLDHAIGQTDAEGWAATTAGADAGHLLYGPYAKDWGVGPARAVFWLMVDDSLADDLVVARLEIYDSTTDEILATRDVPRNAFHAPWAYQRFGLHFDLAGRMGHAMETRLWWLDVSYVRVDRVDVFIASEG